jgi:hypothetical protein
MKRLFLIVTALIGLLVVAGCSLLDNAPEPTLDSNMIQTYAAGTVSARSTFSALETVISILTAQPNALTQQPPSPNSPQVITATSRPPTSTPFPTSTAVQLPTATASKTPAPVTSTPEIPCEWAHFSADVTVPDGTTYAPGAAFTKTWRLLNRGSCTWTTGYSAVFASGNAMSGPAEVMFTKSVKPGDTIDISVNLVAPASTGSYTGYYQVRNASGKTFGTGADGSGRFYVKINVAVATLSDLHIANQVCSAVWKSSSGPVACPTSGYDFSKGSVTSSKTPKLEGGYTDDEIAIIMVPSNGTGGEISGRFPTLEVKSGDHFITTTGFIDSYTKGNIMFMLNYSIDGGADQNLKTWTKTYDSKYVKIDIDLSSLAGKKVQFVLKVLNNDGSSTDDVAFWLNPYIKR